MTYSIDFQGALDRALAPAVINPILDKHIGRAIDAVILDATGYRSEFQKALGEQLSAALPHGLGLDDVAKFQHILNGAMNRLVSESNRAAIETAMQKAVGALLPDTPTVLKLSDFMQDARSGLHVDGNEPFYAYLEETDYGFTHISLDSKERPGDYGRTADREDAKYKAAYQLSVSKDGDVYSLRLNDKLVTPSSLPDVVGSFDAALMAMYVGRTRLEIDMDDDDMRSLSAEQYD